MTTGLEPHLLWFVDFFFLLNTVGACKWKTVLLWTKEEYSQGENLAFRNFSLSSELTTFSSYATPSCFSALYTKLSTAAYHKGGTRCQYPVGPAHRFSFEEARALALFCPHFTRAWFGQSWGKRHQSLHQLSTSGLRWSS